jgi:hypothetical protein
MPDTGLRAHIPRWTNQLTLYGRDDFWDQARAGGYDETLCLAPLAAALVPGLPSKPWPVPREERTSRTQPKRPQTRLNHGALVEQASPRKAFSWTLLSGSGGCLCPNSRAVQF